MEIHWQDEVPKVAMILPLVRRQNTVEAVEAEAALVQVAVPYMGLAQGAEAITRQAVLLEP